ncbi:hypothetical protein Zmor_003784 [Zophobas morio]|uniref:Uncharacterized protein n=1 Tax=Zophobas morio TaxID=2755281 RepID=A0AA38M1P3_9CUCU|nr:hypothetical protein Zmor_003784 [Zophobas morio]
MDRIIADKLEVIQSIGKRGRILHFLIKKEIICRIALYVNLRVAANLEYKGDYLFTSGNGQLLNGYSAIMKHFTKSGASNPSLLRGTSLRKQVATVAQMFSLSDNDIQQIADFMGHDVEVHKRVYRTPEKTLLITKMSKYFMAAEDLNICKYKGKTLEAIGDMAEKEFTEYMIFRRYYP